MKVIIAGASGFVGTELIRQSLSMPNITSVIALARRPVQIPQNIPSVADTTKLQSVVIDNYGAYSDDVKKHFADADACIWTVAITPMKTKNYEWEQVRSICLEDTMAGLKAMFEAQQAESSIAKKFRFLYISGSAGERDQSKKPWLMPKYSLMRGETENLVLAFASDRAGHMEACVAKPGMIIAPGEWSKSIGAVPLNWMGVPSVDIRELAIAMLDQVVNGFETEPLMNNDLVRIGKRVQKSQLKA